MAERYYVNSPLAPGEVVLQGPEAHHLATVLRAKVGDSVILFAGDGVEYPATVIAVERKSVTISVGTPQSPQRELPIHLEVASAIPKGDRGDFLIEKLTELGVTRFVPLKTERSVVHPRNERLVRTVIEASKQCGRNRLMEIDPLTEWNNYCATASAEYQRLIAHPTLLPSPLAGEGSGVRGLDGDALQPQTTHPARKASPPSPAKGEGKQGVLISVGPEGGFTDQEVTMAMDAGWVIVDLGPRILRVETAAIALAAHYVLGSANTA